MTRLSVTNLDCGNTARRSIRNGVGPAYLFNATIAGIDAADALLIVGANPRKEAAVLNARIRKRWRNAKSFPIGLVGPKAPLTYNYDYLGAGSETLADRRPAQFRRCHAQGGASARHRSARRRFARADGAAIASLTAKAAIELGAVKDGWNGYNVLHNAAVARRRARSWLRAGGGRLEYAADGGLRRARRFVPARRRRDRYRRRAPSSSISAPMAIAARRVRTWCCPAPPIRRNRRLTSIPKAGCRWRRGPRFRPAMRARIGRSCARSPTCSERSFRMTSLAATAPALCAGAPASRAHRADRAGRCRRYAKACRLGRQRRQGAVPLERRGLLLHQSDRALLRR